MTLISFLFYNIQHSIPFFIFFQLFLSSILIEKLSTTRVPFDEITTLLNIHSNMIFASSDTLINFLITDVSNYQNENSSRWTKSEFSTMIILSNIYDFYSTKISFDTFFTHIEMSGGFLYLLLFFAMRITMISRWLLLLIFLIYLGNEWEMESVSERVEGLVLRFIVRPDFRTIKLGMIWGRDRQTVDCRRVVWKIRWDGEKSGEAPIVLIVTVLWTNERSESSESNRYCLSYLWMRLA